MQLSSARSRTCNSDGRRVDANEPVGSDLLDTCEAGSDSLQQHPWQNE